MLFMLWEDSGKERGMTELDSWISSKFPTYLSGLSDFFALG